MAFIFRTATVECGDSLQDMKKQKPISQDLIVCDPPFEFDAVETTSISTCNKINDIADQMADTYAYANSKLGWYNRVLNEALFSQPYIKSHTVGAVWNVWAMIGWAVT